MHPNGCGTLTGARWLFIRICTVALAMAAITGRAADEAGLLFYVSGEKGTTADFSAGGTPQPNFDFEVKRIPDGAKGAALQCGDLQRLAWSAPGNIYAQRGTLSFFWRSRYPVGPTEFPVFRVGYADHSSWDMVFLRIDYNGHGFDAFVTDASLSRTRVSITVQPFPKPDEWTHLALSLGRDAGDPILRERQTGGHGGDPGRLQCRTGPVRPTFTHHQPATTSRAITTSCAAGTLTKSAFTTGMLDDAAIATLAEGRCAHRSRTVAGPHS